MAFSDEEILETLAEIVSDETGLETDEVQLDKTFTDDLGMDSLAMSMVQVSAQDKFGVRIPDEEIKNLTHVRDVVSYISKNQG